MEFANFECNGMSVHAAVLLTLAAVAGASPAPTSAATAAEQWNLLAQLSPSDLSDNHYFGWSVGIDIGGQTLAAASIGTAPADDILASWTGSVYVFSADETGSTWTETTKLGASDAASGMYFGWSVSLALPYLVVGTKGHGAYVYTTHDGGSSWNASAKLTKTGDGQDDDSGSDKFGYAVAASSSALAIVGAHGEEHAFVFRRGQQDSWDLVDTLAPSSGTDTDFGLAVAISPDGGLIAVGAPGANAVYVYLLQEGTFVSNQIITRSTNDFGSSVALSELANSSTKLLFIGAADSKKGETERALPLLGAFPALPNPDPDPNPYLNPLSETRGFVGMRAAYRYEATNSSFSFVYGARLNAVTGQQPFEFGGKSAAVGAWAVISAYKETESIAQEGGAAYLFRGDDTQERLVDPDPSDLAQFGRAVAIGATSSGPRVAIASPSSDTSRLNGGRGFVFGPSSTPSPTISRLPSPSPSATPLLQPTVSPAPLPEPTPLPIPAPTLIPYPQPTPIPVPQQPSSSPTPRPSNVPFPGPTLSPSVQPRPTSRLSSARYAAVVSFSVSGLSCADFGSNEEQALRSTVAATLQMDALSFGGTTCSDEQRRRSLLTDSSVSIALVIIGGDSSVSSDAELAATLEEQLASAVSDGTFEAALSAAAAEANAPVMADAVVTSVLSTSRGPTPTPTTSETPADTLEDTRRPAPILSVSLIIAACVACVCCVGACVMLHIRRNRETKPPIPHESNVQSPISIAALHDQTHVLQNAGNGERRRSSAHMMMPRRNSAALATPRMSM